MRKSDVRDLINGFLELDAWRHPLARFSVVDNLELNLLNGKITYPDKDSMFEFYTNKYNWFKERIKKLGGESEFQKAEVKVSGRRERVEIIFKNENISGEKVFGEAVLPDWILNQQNLKIAMRKLKPSCDVSKKNEKDF
jgi:hypothetical protein